MTLLRQHFDVDVTDAMPAAAQTAPITIAGTVVVDPEALRADPVVVLATPGGTYKRNYWDLQPPGRSGYSQAEWTAARGDVFVALDYLGGGDSSRPADGDFMTLEVAADAAHMVFERVRRWLADGFLVALVRDVGKIACDLEHHALTSLTAFGPS